MAFTMTQAQITNNLMDEKMIFEHTPFEISKKCKFLQNL